jgi:hypothetical protein
VCEVCHIFPYCLGKSQSSRSITLWGVLEMFLGGERAAELKEILYGPLKSDPRRTSISHLGNLITLCSTGHDLWNRGIFALKHISGGGYEKTTEMVLELEWLPSHPELSREGVRLDQPVENTSAQFLAGHGLTNWRTRQVIDSGFQFTLTTTDTKDLPLPDERLIDLQWLLTRVLRMSGAAEPVDLDYDETPPMNSPISSVPSLVPSKTRPLSSHQDSPPSAHPTVPKHLILKKWVKRVFKLRKGSGNEQVSL